MISSVTLTAPKQDNLPFYLTALVAAMIATSSIVMLEPAPCDLLFGVCLLLLLVTGRFMVMRSGHALLYVGLLLLLLGNLFSLPFAHDPAFAVRYFMITVYLVVSWLVFTALLGRYGKSLALVVMKAYHIAACVTASVGVLARFHLMPHAEIFMRDTSGMRIKSTFKDPNVLGPFLVGAVVLVVAEMLSSKRVRLHQILCLVLYVSGILFTFSRGAFLNLAVSGFVFVALHLMFRPSGQQLARLSALAVPAAALVLIAGVVALQTTDLTDYFVDRLSFQEYDNNRFGVQGEVMSTAAVTPLGIGPGQWNKSRYRQGVHNTYLRVWVENGFVGLVGYLTFLGGWFMTTWNGLNRRGPYVHYYIAAASVVAGVLVESMVIDTLHWRHYFLFLALPVGLMAHEQDSRAGACVSA